MQSRKSKAAQAAAAARRSTASSPRQIELGRPAGPAAHWLHCDGTLTHYWHHQASSPACSLKLANSLRPQLLPRSPGLPAVIHRACRADRTARQALLLAACRFGCSTLAEQAPVGGFLGTMAGSIARCGL